MEIGIGDDVIGCQVSDEPKLCVVQDAIGFVFAQVAKRTHHCRDVSHTDQAVTVDVAGAAAWGADDDGVCGELNA